MRSILLIATATFATPCGANSDDGEIQAFFIGRQEEKNTSNAKTPRIEQEVWASLTDYDPCVKESILTVSSGRGHDRIEHKSDTVLSENQAEQTFKDGENGIRGKRLALRDSANRSMKWNDGVFYTFNTSDQNVQKLFRMGVKVWTETTCIDFIEDRSASDKVIVVNEGACWSDNGRFGGDQFLSLNGFAVVHLMEGVAVHEIGHALGLLHTMSRPDRDRYITIVMQNVKPLGVNEFDKYDQSIADDYGTPYDYGSVMHYGELSFSANGQPTIRAKDPFHQKTMGSHVISFLDIFIANEHYGCNAKCKKSTSAKCANEGFPHPRNCSICICPGGYGGALCDQRPPGCGEDLVATRYRKLISHSLGQGIGLRDQFDFCNYMITGPAGKKIEVNVQSISDGYDNSGCRTGGVEIKTQKDQKLTGYRFCSVNGSGKPIVSSSSRVPVILFNKFSTMNTVFTYRYID